MVLNYHPIKVAHNFHTPFIHYHHSNLIFCLYNITKVIRYLLASKSS